MKKNSLKNKIQISEVNNNVQNNLASYIQQCERAYKSQIEEIASQVANLKNVKIILLAGPSSAGKTTSALLIKKQLEKHGRHAEVISMDNFFINRKDTPTLEDGSYDFENIKTVDIEYFKQFTDDIFADKVAKMPIFNFIEGRREDEYVNVSLPKNGIVIIEGIHALNPIILNNHEQEVYKIFINPNAEYYNLEEKIVHVRELRRIRRMIRDFYTRGIKPHETMKNWKNVVDGEKEFIFPFKQNADYILDSSHPYELPIYRKYLPALLDGSKETKEIFEDLSYFTSLNALEVPEDSLLNEFLVGVISQIKANKIKD